MLEEPVSLVASRSGVDGGSGGVVSPGGAVPMVTSSDPLGADVLPAGSVAVAVIVWAPLARADVVTE